MKNSNATPHQPAGGRLMSLAALLVMLASVLLLPAAAMAQEPGTTVPQPADTSLPPLIEASSLPLPPMPQMETEADIIEVLEPEVYAASPEALAAAVPAAYMPLVANDHALIQADRMGFGTGVKLSTYSDIRSLYAGWYVNWGVAIKPERPANIEFAQMIRIHQDLKDGCEFATTADRDKCPYKVPASYTYSPSRAVIEAAAKANRGSVWIIGNEIDRVDGKGFRQDEIRPEIYAWAYNELYTIVKTADPTARVAIGGVIQFTPLRMEYLNTIWDSYKLIFDVNMPVDVWNVHNFIGSEYCTKENTERVCYGMGIPPGASVEPNSKGEELGAYVGKDYLHTDMASFEKQIRDFRAWMRDRGQMNKPLIVTEYGVLYKTLCPQDDPATSANERQACINAYGVNFVNLEDPAVVQKFMLDTFNFFMTATDCELSSVDGCRLVQRWAWYSLEDSSWDFNPYTALYNTGSTVRSVTGDKYSKFAADNVNKLQYP